MVKGSSSLSLLGASLGIDRYARACGVRVRSATLADASSIIKLNSAFRIEMSQWEQDPAGVWTPPSYPELSLEEIEDIIEEEGEGAVIVLSRVGEGRQRERPIGYLYSYLEKWGEGGEKSSRRSGGAGGRQSRHAEAGGDSVYIAELFVVANERGLGLGELLLAESLRIRCSSVSRSHLYVSSRNVSAVNCYLKFGFGRSKTPSGDINHDLVMELGDAARCVVDASRRMDYRLHGHATVRGLKVTPPSTPRSGYVSTSSRSSPMLSTPPSPALSEKCGLENARKALWTSPPSFSRRSNDNLPAPRGRGRITRATAQQLRQGMVGCGSDSESSCDEVHESKASGSGRPAPAKGGSGAKRHGGVAKGGVEKHESKQKKGKLNGMVVMLMTAGACIKAGYVACTKKAAGVGFDSVRPKRSGKTILYDEKKIIRGRCARV